MTEMRRLAIYYAPPPGGLAAAAAAWLGRDALKGVAVAQPAIPGLDLAALTEAPRRYGFHGTLKAPFAPAAGSGREALERALAAFAAAEPPVAAGALSLCRIGGFLALVPGEPLAALNALAARLVAGFEPFRAPLAAAEIARRRPARLTARQRALLDRYGYPFVMEEFRFHLTLTGPLADGPEAVAAVEAVEAAARDWFAPHLAGPFRIADLCLFGEDAAGRFHCLSRHALSG